MDKQKRNFEFRMSKKVAELTQVVHMLFTRNHEKEVEIEVLKEAYELEVNNVIQDAEKKIKHLKEELEEVKGHLASKGDNMRKVLQEEFKEKEAALNRRLTERGEELNSERQECRNIRDLLINAQKDIEQLRQRVSEQINLKSDEITKRDRDLERLRKQVQQLEKAVRDSEKTTSSTVRDFEKSNVKLETELTQMNDLLEESQRVQEQMSAKVKFLEAELKALKKEINRRVAEAVANHVNKIPRSAPAYMSHNEELEHLRREIQRYRLELSNRDSNFNRVFSSQQPMIVNNRLSTSMSSPKPPTRSSTNLSNGMMHNGVGHPVLVNSFTKTSSRNPKQTTVPQATPVKGNIVPNSIFSYYEEFSNNARPLSASSQLPSISSAASSGDARARAQALAKPRPLPREMLFTK